MSTEIFQISLSGLINVHLLRGEQGLVLVDTGPPGEAENITRQMLTLGFDPRDLRLILITHGHVDHFGSAADLQAQFDVPVAVHRADAPALRQGVNLPGSTAPTTWVLSLVERLSFSPLPTTAPPLAPDIVFYQDWSLEKYGIAGRVLHTPGHTPGSCSVLLESGEAVVGDLVAGKLTRWLRRPAWPYVAWNLSRSVESLRQLVALEPHIFYLTHGGPFTLAAVKRLLAAANEK